MIVADLIQLLQEKPQHESVFLDTGQMRILVTRERVRTNESSFDIDRANKVRASLGKSGEQS